MLCLIMLICFSSEGRPINHLRNNLSLTGAHQRKILLLILLVDLQIFSGDFEIIVLGTMFDKLFGNGFTILDSIIIQNYEPTKAGMYQRVVRNNILASQNTIINSFEPHLKDIQFCECNISGVLLFQSSTSILIFDLDINTSFSFCFFGHRSKILCHGTLISLK